MKYSKEKLSFRRLFVIFGLFLLGFRYRNSDDAFNLKIIHFTYSWRINTSAGILNLIHKVTRYFKLFKGIIASYFASPSL